MNSTLTKPKIRDQIVNHRYLRLKTLTSKKIKFDFFFEKNSEKLIKEYTNGQFTKKNNEKNPKSLYFN